MHSLSATCLTARVLVPALVLLCCASWIGCGGASSDGTLSAKSGIDEAEVAVDIKSLTILLDHLGSYRMSSLGLPEGFPQQPAEAGPGDCQQMLQVDCLSGHVEVCLQPDGASVEYSACENGSLSLDGLVQTSSFDGSSGVRDYALSLGELQLSGVVNFSVDGDCWVHDLVSVSLAVAGRGAAAVAGELRFCSGSVWPKGALMLDDGGSDRLEFSFDATPVAGLTIEATNPPNVPTACTVDLTQGSFVCDERP